jgi:hypothetical protein
VPLVSAPPLGPARPPAQGQVRGGIPCVTGEQLDFHIHARLTLFVKGKARSVPRGVGIGRSCLAFLHTHYADGIIHIEAPGKVGFKLGQFFDVWRQRLDRRHLGRYSGRVTAWVNGRRFRGDPRAILLTKHAQVQLELGQPLRAPVSIEFPPGL